MYERNGGAESAKRVAKTEFNGGGGGNNGNGGGGSGADTGGGGGSSVRSGGGNAHIRSNQEPLQEAAQTAVATDSGAFAPR
eukprot:6194538-Pleurochrysis_carterae.AAC.2